MKHLIYLIKIGILAYVFISCNPPTDVPGQQKDKAWVLSNFTKADDLNPILQPEDTYEFECPIRQKKVKWEERNVLNPAAVVRNDSVFLFYRAQDTSGTSRIGIAVSTDGLHFEKRPGPVLYPDHDAMQKYEWNYKKLLKDTIVEYCSNCFFDGVEDPRIIESEDERYIMTYTAYDGKTARLCVASSEDLLSWDKHGLAFKDEKYKDLWSKAGAIVAERKDNKFVAKKVNGKYWMYFGDTNIFLASSDDLINWTICENEENGNRIAVLHPRAGYFDSRLVEPGPFAWHQEAGIVLIYNASNAATFNDTALPKFTYAAGQALFDEKSPHKLIDRTNSYFIHPDKPYEKLGEVNEVCFVEGLVYLKEKWFLYYGTADSKVAVAVRK
jgi:predicted GH43/DUF377 family glycosyl hydrolase